LKLLLVRCALLSLAAAAFLPHACDAQPEVHHDLVVTPEKASGIYEPGEKIRWRIEWKGDEPVTSADYTLKEGQIKTLSDGTVPLEAGVGTLEASLDKPGSLLAEIKVKTTDGKERKAYGGALVAPDKIAPSAPRPDDFDDFWAAKIKQLEDVPANPQLESADGGKAGVEYWKITLDNINSTKIHGQLARPSSSSEAPPASVSRDAQRSAPSDDAAKNSSAVSDKKLPALLFPQWAGVYPLEKAWATDRAAEGWLVLNIIAHDLPIDEPPSFYHDQLAGPLKDYWAIGNDDRETAYFLRMYLSCYRAAQYLMSRPDWDGKTLVVCGTSQGGQQTLVTAALVPQVTAALAIVPAGCDMLGPEANRRGGWPQWYDQAHGKDQAKVHEASRYFDVVNFASRIKCPVLVGFGLIDQTCPAEGVMAAMNQVTSPKELIALPLAEHQEINHAHKAYMDRCYNAWLPALRQGKPAPLNK
jgi:cephalosporin-C deacetylase-like acetyl esterase